MDKEDKVAIGYKMNARAVLFRPSFLGDAVNLDFAPQGVIKTRTFETENRAKSYLKSQGYRWNIGHMEYTK